MKVHRSSLVASGLWIPCATCSRYSCLCCRSLDVQNDWSCNSQPISGDGCTLPMKCQFWNTWGEVLMMMTHLKLILKRELLKQLFMVRLQRDHSLCSWKRHRISGHSSLKSLTILIHLFKITLCLMCKKSLGGKGHKPK